MIIELIVSRSIWEPDRCLRPGDYTQIEFIVVGLFALSAFVMGCAAPPEPPSNEPAKNAIVIVVDTLRADRLGFMGGTRPTSPIIDDLVEKGAVFREAFANSPWTVPSTASMMTSLLASEHGAEITGEPRFLEEEVPHQMHVDAQTLSMIFNRAGFRTGLFSGNPFLYGRFKDGFDTTEVNRQSAGDLADHVLDFLDTVGEDRFFIHIQFIDLHHPVDPPAPFFDFFPTPDSGPREENHKNWSFGEGQHLDTGAFEDYKQNKLALYDGAIRYVDSEIGRLLGELSSRALSDNTLIVITSDHGEEFWDHAEIGLSLGGDPRDTYGIGHGHSMFRELLLVPFVVVGPRVAQGLDLEGRMTLLDLAPTILDILDLPVPGGMRGRSLRPLLSGAQDTDLPQPLVYADSPAYGPNAWSLVSGRWKIISRADGATLLFDVESDPDETLNLCVREPVVAARMAAELQDVRSSIRPSGPTEKPALDEETEDQLRALGYVN